MSRIASIRRFFDTVRYLRLRQIYARLARAVWRPGADLRPPPAVRPVSGRWCAPAERSPSLFSKTEFEFLGVRGSVVAPEDWNARGATKLWLYNLHYFDDLNATGAAVRETWHRDLLDRWIDENPPGIGSGWDPYPVSLRIVNWVKWALAGHEPGRRVTWSLAVQVRHLRSRLEFHLLGNHLISNAKALVFAGCYFGEQEGARWLRQGLAVLERQLREQVLADGGHVERSTMYHTLVLEDALDLVNVLHTYGKEVPHVLKAAVDRMRGWLAAMSHPDGEISFFNDAAIGIAPAPAAIEAYALRLGFPSLRPQRDGMTHLAPSGYIRLKSGSAVAIIDTAPIGPDYLPGHAHADTLSFEWSLGTCRVIVNSGTSTYEEGPQRMLERGTSAHSTVTVDDCDSSEMWGAFRVARRARPFGLRVNPGDMSVACSHDGYRRLAGDVVHRREWRFDSVSLRVVDRISGEYSTVQSRFHLHPTVEAIVSDDGRSGDLLLPDGSRVEYKVSQGRAMIATSFHHPRFGASIPAKCLEIVPARGLAVVDFELAGPCDTSDCGGRW